TLEEREWIRVVGYRDVPGKPELFGTTKSFLDYFVLKSLDELPPLAEIRDVEEFDAQLTLGPAAPADAVDEDADAAQQAQSHHSAADADPSAGNDDPDNPVTQAAAAADSATPEQTA